MVPEVIRVLVVDDHTMFAEAIEMLLEGTDDVRITGIAATAEEALAACEADPPDVVLMDIDLAGMDGIDATGRVRELSPETKVVIITAFQEPSVIARALQAGAAGYVPKTRASDELLGVIRRAATGEMVLPAGDIRDILAQLQLEARSKTSAELSMSQLTVREIHVLRLFAEGGSTNEIAKELFISAFTVQSHVKSILSKLNVHSKLEAVAFALRHGLVTLGRSNGADHARRYR